jgi:hypothetical protein
MFLYVCTFVLTVVKVLRPSTPRVYADNECCICLTSAPSVTLQPCRHKVLCHPCSQELTSCPICRGPIDYLLFSGGVLSV